MLDPDPLVLNALLMSLTHSSNLAAQDELMSSTPQNVRSSFMLRLGEVMTTSVRVDFLWQNLQEVFPVFPNFPMKHMRASLKASTQGTQADFGYKPRVERLPNLIPGIFCVSLMCF